MTFTKFNPNTKAKAGEVNDNFAFISGNRLIAVNPSTGSAILDFPIGDLAAIGTGSLAGDILARSGKSLKVHNSSGVLIGEVDYDQLLNLQDASTTQRGTVELLTNAELAAGTDTTRAATAANILSLFRESNRTSKGFVRLPIRDGGVFQEIIIQWGSNSVNTNSSLAVTLSATFPNTFLAASISRQGTDIGELATAQFIKTSNSIITLTNAGGTELFDWIAIGF